MVCCLPTYIPTYLHYITLHYITLHYINRHASQAPLEHYECDFRLFRATRWPWLCGQNNDKPSGVFKWQLYSKFILWKARPNSNFRWSTKFCMVLGFNDNIVSIFVLMWEWSKTTVFPRGLTHQSPDLLTPRSGWIILDQGELSETGPSGLLGHHATMISRHRRDVQPISAPLLDPFGLFELNWDQLEARHCPTSASLKGRKQLHWIGCRTCVARNTVTTRTNCHIWNSLFRVYIVSAQLVCVSCYITAPFNQGRKGARPADASTPLAHPTSNQWASRTRLHLDSDRTDFDPFDHQNQCRIMFFLIYQDKM